MHKIITNAREFGRRLSEQLGFAYCGREIIREISKSTGPRFHSPSISGGASALRSIRPWSGKLNFDLCINTTQTVIKEIVPAVAKLFCAD